MHLNVMKEMIVVSIFSLYFIFSVFSDTVYRMAAISALFLTFRYLYASDLLRMVSNICLYCLPSTYISTMLTQNYRFQAISALIVDDYLPHLNFLLRNWCQFMHTGRARRLQIARSLSERCGGVVEVDFRTMKWRCVPTR